MARTSGIFVNNPPPKTLRSSLRGKQLEITKPRGIHGKAVEFSQQAWNSACIMEFGVFLKTPFRRPRRFPSSLHNHARVRVVWLLAVRRPLRRHVRERRRTHAERRETDDTPNADRGPPKSARSPRAVWSPDAPRASHGATRAWGASCASRRRRGTGARRRRGLASPRRAQGRTNDRREQNNSHTKPRGAPARLRRREPPDCMIRNEIARAGPSGRRSTGSKDCEVRLGNFLSRRSGRVWRDRG